MARVNRSFSRETGGADKQCRRSQSEKVAELAPRHLRFFIAVVGTIDLMRSSCCSHIALVAPTLRQNFGDRFLGIRTHCSCPIVRLASRSMIRWPVAAQFSHALQTLRSRQLQPHSP